MFDPPISSQAVSQWERVPAARCLVIEAATKSRVTRHDLRPDIYGPPPPRQEAA
jgi:DNA-binding transcriptional regulator YdaS (Cro superfamily)